ncbi:MAG: polysaccharide biosynthesis tyrosine autokinase [Muribaculaceae bacterium]|nr:polysaccharide biosynthesis tyrosine autokinase [Muribaculaceae bacterium]
MQDFDNNGAGDNEGALSITDILWMCLSRWYWFVISLVICCGLGGLYILRKAPVYERSATLLIKNTDSSAATDVSQAISNMGFATSNSDVDDELASIKSPTVMIEVVKRLGLEVSYIATGKMYPVTLYGRTLPASFSFIGLGETGTGALRATLDEDGSLTIERFTGKKGKKLKSEPISGYWNRPDTLESPLGLIAVTPNKDWKVDVENQKWPIVMKVKHVSVASAARSFSKKLKAEVPDDYSSIITLDITDTSIQRAENILQGVIDVYNEDWVNDKNRLSAATENFIRERLAVIENELGDVDNDISTYKSHNLVPDLAQASALYFNQAAESDREADELASRLKLARHISSLLNDPDHAGDVLPASTSLQNLNIETQISNYNTLLLQRNSLVANSSESNPIVVDLDRQLKGLRSSVLKSVDTYIETLSSEARRASDARAEAARQLEANPSQARYLLSVERQQKVKESLYLYLLQRREENELSQAFTAYNTRVITPPMGDDIPVAPSKAKIMLIAFVLGLVIPGGAVYLSEALNTRVRGRKDVESLTLPFVGEIPLGYRRRRGIALLRKARENERDRRVVVVEKGSHNVINEAFRVIRTNLELMMDSDSVKNRTIMVTSANPGSGKTFITMNLAVALAIKNKKVVVVDLDLRKASLSAFAGSPAKGVSAFLTGHASLDQIIVRNVNQTEGLDIVPVGALPPNPAELLYSPRLRTMLDELRNEYDYVLLDCPPVEVVADAKIINHHADLTLFVVRAGLFERDMLPQVERFYTTGRYHNMALILNGTETNSFGPLHSPYGYGYGYGYVYGSSGEKHK